MDCGRMSVGSTAFDGAFPNVVKAAKVFGLTTPILVQDTILVLIVVQTREVIIHMLFYQWIYGSVDTEEFLILFV